MTGPSATTGAGGPAAQAEPVPPWTALAQSGAALTAVQGLGSRFHQVVSPRGAAQGPALRACAFGWAAVDVAKALALRGSRPFALWPRLAIDVVDLAFWCALAGDDPDTTEDAVIPGVSLAAEASARLGPYGLVVPLVNATVAGAVRRIRGHRLRLGQFSWQLMGVGGGWTLSLLAQRQQRRHAAQHRIEVEAQLQRAELAGFHDVIMEHEGAIDLLQRASVLIDLGSPNGASRRRDMAGVLKAAMAQAVRGRDTYLREAFSVWQARHNLSPALAHAVQVDLPPDAGTVVLTARQTAALHEWLGHQDLAGHISVELADPRSARIPFGPRDLRVDGRVVALPGERDVRRWSFDALPAAFLLDIGWLTQPVARHREAVPWSATLPTVAFATAASIWSAWRGEHRDIASPGTAIVLSFVSTMLYALLSTRNMRNPHTGDGISRFPWVMALQGYELVRGIASTDLSSQRRVAAALGAGAIIAVGWAISPAPRSARALVAELGWVVGFDLFARRLRHAIAQVGDEVGARASEQDAAEVAEAYERGRRRIYSIMGSELHATRHSLEQSWSQLPIDIRSEAGRRLDRVAILLSA